MAIVCWDDSLRTNVEVVDKQHKYLFEIINNMQEKLVHGHFVEALIEGLDSMRTYARYHFEIEERLLEEQGYPELKVHRQAHREFIETLDRLGADEPTAEMAHQALGFLLTWLVTHIQFVDGRYAPFLNERSVR